MLLAFALALAFGFCKAPTDAASAIAGAGDVRVTGVRFVPSPDTGPGLAAAGVTYVVTTLTLTNASAHDFTPSVDRFMLTAPNARYAGMDSGSAVFIGVSNSHRVLKYGAARAYTVGFRTTDPVAAGVVSYEP